jgi:hypothetical protein
MDLTKSMLKRKMIGVNHLYLKADQALPAIIIAYKQSFK